MEEGTLNLVFNNQYTVKGTIMVQTWLIYHVFEINLELLACITNLVMNKHDSLISHHQSIRIALSLLY